MNNKSYKTTMAQKKKQIVTKQKRNTNETMYGD